MRGQCGMHGVVVLDRGHHLNAGGLYYDGWKIIINDDAGEFQYTDNNEGCLLCVVGGAINIGAWSVLEGMTRDGWLIWF